MLKPGKRALGTPPEDLGLRPRVKLECRAFGAGSSLWVRGSGSSSFQSTKRPELAVRVLLNCAGIQGVRFERANAS
jgi:hypothetical protein